MTQTRVRYVCGAAKRVISGLLMVVFTFGTVLPPYVAQAQVIPMLPLPGVMVAQSQGYVPALIRGLIVHPENPLEFDFIINTGDSGIAVDSDAFKAESMRLIKYFLAALTVPGDEMWVNLSPYEKDRVIPEVFGQTDMGIDLLAQDYILKQLTASLMYPEEGLGKRFWKRVHDRARREFGTTDIPMESFHKVWIIPDQAVVYEKGNTALVIQSRLKVMMEEDYFAMQESQGKGTGNESRVTSDALQVTSNRLQVTRDGLQGNPVTPYTLSITESSPLTALQTEVMREVILPEIEKEVNEGEHFANLRQIYQGAILAAWFKGALKESLLGQVYVDRGKVRGVDTDDPAQKEAIYQQYVEAFEKGVYNYIKEEYDPQEQTVLPRHYFSGGASTHVLPAHLTVSLNPARDGLGDLHKKTAATMEEVGENTLVKAQMDDKDPKGNDKTPGQSTPQAADSGDAQDPQDPSMLAARVVNRLFSDSLNFQGKVAVISSGNRYFTSALRTVLRREHFAALNASGFTTILDMAYSQERSDALTPEQPAGQADQQSPLAVSTVFDFYPWGMFRATAEAALEQGAFAIYVEDASVPGEKTSKGFFIVEPGQEPAVIMEQLQNIFEESFSGAIQEDGAEGPAAFAREMDSWRLQDFDEALTMVLENEGLDETESPVSRVSADASMLTRAGQNGFINVPEGIEGHALFQFLDGLPEDVFERSRVFYALTGKVVEQARSEDPQIKQGGLERLHLLIEQGIIRKQLFDALKLEDMLWKEQQATADDGGKNKIPPALKGVFEAVFEKALFNDFHRAFKFLNELNAGKGSDVLQKAEKFFDSKSSEWLKTEDAIDLVITFLKGAGDQALENNWETKLSRGLVEYIFREEPDLAKTAVSRIVESALNKHYFDNSPALSYAVGQGPQPIKDAAFKDLKRALDEQRNMSFPEIGIPEVFMQAMSQDVMIPEDAFQAMVDIILYGENNDLKADVLNVVAEAARRGMPTLLEKIFFDRQLSHDEPWDKMVSIANVFWSAVDLDDPYVMRAGLDGLLALAEQDFDTFLRESLGEKTDQKQNRILWLMRYSEDPGVQKSASKLAGVIMAKNLSMSQYLRDQVVRTISELAGLIEPDGKQSDLIESERMAVERFVIFVYALERAQATARNGHFSFRIDEVEVLMGVLERLSAPRFTQIDSDLGKVVVRAFVFDDAVKASKKIDRKNFLDMLASLYSDSVLIADAGAFMGMRMALADSDDARRQIADLFLKKPTHYFDPENKRKIVAMAWGYAWAINPDVRVNIQEVIFNDQLSIYSSGRVIKLITHILQTEPIEASVRIRKLQELYRIVPDQGIWAAYDQIRQTILLALYEEWASGAEMGEAGRDLLKDPIDRELRRGGALAFNYIRAVDQFVKILRQGGGNGRILLRRLEGALSVAFETGGSDLSMAHWHLIGFALKGWGSFQIFAPQDVLSLNRRIEETGQLPPYVSSGIVSMAAVLDPRLAGRTDADSEEGGDMPSTDASMLTQKADEVAGLVAQNKGKERVVKFASDDPEFSEAAWLAFRRGYLSVSSDTNDSAIMAGAAVSEAFEALGDDEFFVAFDVASLKDGNINEGPVFYRTNADLFKKFMSTMSEQFGEEMLGDVLDGALNQWNAGNESLQQTVDFSGASSKNTGGIDLDPALMGMTIKRDVAGIPLPLDQQVMEELLLIEGLFPVIINVTPVVNLPLALGMADPPGDERGGPEQHLGRLDVIDKAVRWN